MVFSFYFSYVQLIVIQLKENQLLGTSTNEKILAANVDKDYKTQVKGEPYITAEFDYGKMKTFRIGDGKYYSRSVRRKRRATGDVFSELKPTIKFSVKSSTGRLFFHARLRGGWGEA